MELHAKFSTFDGVSFDNPREDRELVGCLYLTVTCPDIAYAVEVVSQFCPFVVLPVVLLFYVSCATFIALSTSVYCSPLLQV